MPKSRIRSRVEHIFGFMEMSMNSVMGTSSLNNYLEVFPIFPTKGYL